METSPNAKPFEVKLGLKENWPQFALLVLINAFVGGMLGMERSIFAAYTSQLFGLSSHSALLSFILVFGLSKAIANYFVGKLATKISKKKLLVFGWFMALPVPYLLAFANSWNQVLLANLLLGVSQGFTWSTTVLMKIDIVGEKNRGLAMGLNEFSGYLALAIVAYFSAYLAHTYGLTPYPFIIGMVLSAVGLLLSMFAVKDTQVFVAKETLNSQTPLLKNVFKSTSYAHKTLGSVTQAGLINNLNDGMIWGLLPLVLLQLNFNQSNIGIISGIYPAVWGISQLFTGKLADHYPKKQLLFWGMLLQGLAILGLVATSSFWGLSILSALLGFGTALVYPTFLSLIAQEVHPSQRATSIGIFRFWRDLGYAIGALLSGIIADALGLEWAMAGIGLLTILSAGVIKVRM